MKPTAISSEYLDLQTEISNKQTEWTKLLDNNKVAVKQPLKHKEVPVIGQTTVNVDETLYKIWLIELAEFLVSKDKNLAPAVSTLKEKLTDELIKKWLEEVTAYNQVYFQTFAKEVELPEWLPYFLAEHSLRPFLRIVSEVYSEVLGSLNTKGSCACCGEPLRLATLESKGTKMIACPRCEAKWNQKRIHCAFCGNEDHDKISYYNIETDKNAKLEVCEACNSYIKLIDTRKLFKKQTAFLLDVTTIHLDFVAQEKGFGVTKEVHIKS